MPFQRDPDRIHWRMHLNAPVERVYEALSTDAGRASFWAESAPERDGVVYFTFPNGLEWAGEVLEAAPPFRYSLRYYDNTTVVFTLQDDGQGGTDLELTDTGVPAASRNEVIAGWVSVLMSLKGAVDFGIDLRNHDDKRTWDQGYMEN